MEFRLGATLLRGSHVYWLVMLLLGIPLLLVLAVAYIIAVDRGATANFQEILLSFWNSPKPGSSMQLWLLVILIPVGLLMLVLHRFTYIRIASDGMEGYIPGLLGQGIIGLSTGHWRIPWGSIRSVHLLPPKKWTKKPAFDLKAYRLVIETDREQIRLSPFPWVLRDAPDHRLSLRNASRMKGFDATEVIERAPLIRALRARGIEFSTTPPAAENTIPAEYDLAKHRGLVLQLVLFFAAGLYALIDGLVFDTYKALEPLPVGPFVLVGLTGAAIALVLGRGAPPAERAIVGALMVAALTAAVYPGLLRFNALTAEPQQVPYRAVSIGRFESMESGFPDMDLRGLDIDKYWLQYPEGMEHPFVLLRGEGGFYQLDLAPLYQRTRDYYSANE
jgi:hypothetical protein